MNELVANKATPSSTKEMLNLIEQFTEVIWANEPTDLKSLREVRRPPMGNMPCVLYASFNLFWLGESLQVWRSVAQNRTLPVEALSFAVSQSIERHAIRLTKWQLQDTLRIVKSLYWFFLDRVPRSHEDCADVLGSALIAIDRVQNWIDCVIPWSKMDQALGELRRVE